MKTKILFLCLLFFNGIIDVIAQPSVQIVKISVSPDSPDWKYKTGQNVKFNIRVTENNIPLKDVSINYELSYDMMPAFENKEIFLKNGETTVQGGTMKQPGFLRCIVKVNYNGKKYSGLATAGFEPENIKPTVTCPTDFKNFWNSAIEANSKIPLSPKMTILPESCTDLVNVYHVSFQNYAYGSRIYGILSVPKGDGKYPAILIVPGAGVRGYRGDVQRAEKGVITLEIGIHGIPVTMDNQVYESLVNAALKNYFFNNWDNKDNIYYKRVYLGCIKSVDFIFGLEEFDGKNIIVQGGSQGGALALVTAALDSRIKGLACFYPALSDLTGYLHGRAGGWPHLFRNSTDSKAVLEEKVKTAGYYDAVNFARQIKVPGFYSFGFNDMVCPPTSVCSAVNSIDAPKEIMIVPETEHWNYQEQRDKRDEWIFKLFNL